MSTARQYKRAGEIAIAVWACETIAYELLFDDLISVATRRWIDNHPIFPRLVILAVAGHLAWVLPHQVDVFDARNIFHRAVIKVVKR